MTRFEHHLTRGAAVAPGPAGPAGTHEIRIEDGSVTLVLRFGSAAQMAAFAVVPYAYVLRQAQPVVSGVDDTSTGVWRDQGSAGEPVRGSGEGGTAATTRAQPADPGIPSPLAAEGGER